jgi:hypothetical protein
MLTVSVKAPESNTLKNPLFPHSPQRGVYFSVVIYIHTSPLPVTDTLEAVHRAPLSWAVDSAGFGLFGGVPFMYYGIRKRCMHVLSRVPQSLDYCLLGGRVNIEAY